MDCPRIAPPSAVEIVPWSSGSTPQIPGSTVTVTLPVGDCVGGSVGDSVCDFVGVSVGAGVVGGSVGDKVGVALGVCVGAATNSTDGAIVGETASPSDGAVVRADVGDGTAVCAEIIGLGDGDTVSEAG